MTTPFRSLPVPPPLSPNQVEQFHRDGYLTQIDLLNGAEVQELRERLTSIGERLEELGPQLYEVERAWLERPDETVLHFLGAWRVDGWFADLIRHPGVTHPIAQLLGTKRLRFWHDQVFWKPARHPGVVPWHQDYSYWTRTGPPGHLTLFLSLDDMGPENGGLEYVPGSHEWGLLPAQEFGGDMDALKASLTEEQAANFAPVPLRLRAGQAAIHHSHLIHGSRGNPSDRPRRAVVLNYMRDGTLALSDEPLLRGTPAPVPNTPVQGDDFPLVLSD